MAACGLAKTLRCFWLPSFASEPVQPCNQNACKQAQSRRTLGLAALGHGHFAVAAARMRRIGGGLKACARGSMAPADSVGPRHTPVGAFAAVRPISTARSHIAASPRLALSIGRRVDLRVGSTDRSRSQGVSTHAARVRRRRAGSGGAIADIVLVQLAGRLRRRGARHGGRDERECR
jgi:hypothetical protein